MLNGLWGLLSGRRTFQTDDLVPGSRRPPSKWVTERSALNLSTAWACVRLLSESIATLPLQVYRREGAHKDLARDHPLYALLHDSPNAEQTAAEFWEAMVVCLCLWGNGYAEKRTSSRGLTSLEFLRPDLMSVDRKSDGEVRYIYRSTYGTARTMSSDEVFHLRGFGAGGEVGLSPIGYAQLSLGAAFSAEEAASAVMANGLQQPLMIDSGQMKLSKEQRTQIRQMIQEFSGSENAGKVLVLEAGMKPMPIAFNPDDAQLLQTRAFNVEEICRWFRVPPFMVGHTEKSTSWGTGLEQQTIGFLTFSLRPYLTRIEQAISKQLIRPAERSSIYAEFNLEGLLRGDSAARAQVYSTHAQNGIATRNEIRARENLPPVAGGDELTVQSNLVPLKDL